MKPKSSSMKKTSAAQNTATGSGSRPTGGKFPIATSAPKHPHKTGRQTPSALK